MNTAVAQRAAARTWSVVVEVATGVWWAVKLMVALILLQVAVAGVAFSSVALFSPDEMILLFVKKEVSTDTHDKALARDRDMPSCLKGFRLRGLRVTR